MILSNRLSPGWEKDWKAGRWNPDLCEQAWTHASARPTARNIQLAFKVQHALAGLHRHHLELVEKLISSLKNPWQPITIQLLSARLLFKQEAAADRILQRYLGGALTPIRSSQLAGFPLALAHMLDRQPHRLQGNLQKLAEKANALQRQMQQINPLFIHSLTENISDKCTVAVVGNAPNLLQHQDGALIDQHQLVVRFNAASLTEKYRPHIGTRTDLWVVSPSLSSRQPSLPARAMVISGINPLVGRSRYWRTLATRKFPRIAQFNELHWYGLIEQLSAPPSAGLLMLKSLCENQSRLQVSAFGFTRPDEIAGQLSGANYHNRKPGSNRHNWQAEALVLEELLSSLNGS